MTENVNDFFAGVAGGAGAPTALLKNPGDTVHGEIVDIQKRDYVPFGKTEPEADPSEPDGKRKQLVVVIQTENRNWANVAKIPKVNHEDPNSPTKDPSEDDGKRAIYIPNRSNIQYAVARAIQASKAPFEVGGTLGVKVFNLKDTGKGNPLKEHEAVYQGKSAGSGFFPTSEAPAAAPAAPPAPAAQPAAPAGDPWATPGTAAQPPF